MLEHFRRTANRLQTLQQPLLLLSGGLFCVLVYLVVIPPSADTEGWITPALIGLLWSGSAYVFLTTFGGERLVPHPAHGRLRRLRIHLTRLWLGLVAVAFVAMTLGVTYLTIKLLADLA